MASLVGAVPHVGSPAEADFLLEDQLRTECYELHGVRTEVADLLNHQRDIECRHEYLKTVLANMQRSEEQLKRTLAYETATSDAVLHAARNGQPLPPALAADAATSVLCPPVHLGRENKNLFQTSDDVQRRRNEERRQLEKEIADMETVIAAERRSIGTLQHAMSAQAAMGDSVIEHRRIAHRLKQDALTEIATAQAETKTVAHSEEVLRQRIEAHSRELDAKTRRLQEVQDLTRIGALQLEELRSAVVAGRRDMLRAQTLETECKTVARVATDKVSAIGHRQEQRVGGAGGGALLAHAAGPMFVSALGGPGGAVSVAVTQGGGSNNADDPAPGQVASGSQRYRRGLYETPTIMSGGRAYPRGGSAGGGRSRSGGARGGGRAGAAGGGGSGHHHHDHHGGHHHHHHHQEQPQHHETHHQSQHQQAGAAAAAGGSRVPPPASSGSLPTFGWTAGSPLRRSGAVRPGPDASPEERQAFIAHAYSDAHADANEWLRRYVGSLRGLHLTALESSLPPQ